MSDQPVPENQPAPESGVDPEAYDASEDLDQLLAEDSQVAGEDDPLDAGYSPPERPLGMREELTLDQRLAEEAPEEADPPADAIGDVAGGDGEPLDQQVGGRRAGRLTVDDGSGTAEDDTLVGRDVGIDGGAAGAEEAAVHVVPDDEGT